MKKSELVSFLNKKFIFANQESWDNCGPTPKTFDDDEITKIFVSLDMNYQAIKQAIVNNCNVVISHHPILINDEEPIDQIKTTNENIITILKQHKILNIALHTCFDRCQYNNSFLIYQAIKKGILSSEYHFLDENNYLLVTHLIQPMSLVELLTQIKKSQIPFINKFRFLNTDKQKIIKTIAIGAGSCASMLKNCLANKIDCFFTGDVKWHNYLDGLNNQLIMVDIMHTSERVFMNQIVSVINKQFTKLELIVDNKLVEIEEI